MFVYVTIRFDVRPVMNVVYVTIRFDVRPVMNVCLRNNKVGR